MQVKTKVFYFFFPSTPQIYDFFSFCYYLYINKLNIMATKKITLNELRSIVKQIIKEETENKTYSVYELYLGQPYNFYNEEKNDFVWGEPTMATLYTKEDAEIVRRKLLKPRVDYYQKTGKNYKEIHIGDLFKKGLRK